MAWNPNCDKKYQKNEDDSKESTKNYLVAHGIIDKYNNIQNLNDFRNAISYLTNIAKDIHNVDKGKLYLEEKGGKTAVPNYEAFKAIDIAKKQPIIKEEEKIPNKEEKANIPEKQSNAFNEVEKIGEASPEQIDSYKNFMNVKEEDLNNKLNNCK